MKLRSITCLLALLSLASGSPFASLGTITKTPAEAFNSAVSFPFSALNGITLVSVAATDTQTGSDVTANIIATSPAPTVATSITANGVTKIGQFALFRITGGTNNQRVLIDVVVMDNVTGETFDGQVSLIVLAGLAH